MGTESGESRAWSWACAITLAQWQSFSNLPQFSLIQEVEAGEIQRGLEEFLSKIQAEPSDTSGRQHGQDAEEYSHDVWLNLLAQTPDLHTEITPARKLDRAKCQDIGPMNVLVFANPQGKASEKARGVRKRPDKASVSSESPMRCKGTEGIGRYEGPGLHGRWLKEEDGILRQAVQRLIQVSNIQKHYLPNRPIVSIRGRLERLGIKYRARKESVTERIGRFEGTGTGLWTEEEDHILTQALLNSMTYLDIREHHLPNRTVDSMAGRTRLRMAGLGAGIRRPQAKPFYCWTPERCARLIQVKRSHKEKSWEKIVREHFPESNLDGIMYQWSKMRKQDPNLPEHTVEKVNHNCKECGKKFAEKRGLESHYNAEHAAIPTIYACPKCGVYTSKSQDVYRKLVQKCRGPLICPKCGRRDFQNRGFLTRHVGSSKCTGSRVSDVNA
jgi:hypothetical protein